jgi:hypothetical protein
MYPASCFLISSLSMVSDRIDIRLNQGISEDFWTIVDVPNSLLSLIGPLRPRRSNIVGILYYAASDMGIPQGNPTAFPSIADYVRHPSVFLYKWGHLCLGKHQSPQMQLTTLSAFVFCAVSSVVGLSIVSPAHLRLRSY